MDSQGLNEECRKILEDVYIKMSAILEQPDLYGEPHEVVEQIEGLEYTMQYLWGFSFDRKYHRYWKEVSGCICPKLDNQDPLYHGVRITDTTCKFHGNKENH